MNKGSNPSSDTRGRDLDGRRGAENPASSRELLAGLVERVTFHNPENGFCVLRIKARGHRDMITVVGHAAVHIRRGMDHRLGGMDQRPDPWAAIPGSFSKGFRSIVT